MLYPPKDNVYVYEYCVHAGGEGEGNWVMPDIFVNVIRPGEDAHIGVVREVMMVCSIFTCSIE